MSFCRLDWDSLILLPCDVDKRSNTDQEDEKYQNAQNDRKSRHSYASNYEVVLRITAAYLKTNVALLFREVIYCVGLALYVDEARSISRYQRIFSMLKNLISESFSTIE